MTEKLRSGSMPTLEMVAAEAGVSRATVSRVVNHSPKVSPDVAAVVQAAIEQLNYVPNRAARSLVSRRTQAIAMVVPESAAKVFDDPFFAAVVQGVAQYLEDTDYTLNMIIESGASSHKTRRYLLGGNVDGALVVSHHTGDHSYSELSRTLPVVFGGRPLGAVDGDNFYVDVDNFTGACSAVEHLVASGRTRLATIAGPQDMPPGVDRLSAFHSTLSKHGLTSDLVETGDFSPPSGAEAMRRLLARGEPIDGIFAANDQMAIGAYSAIREAGLSVPGDIAVVGFDDDNYGSTATPPLTTVRQPSIEMGRCMAEKIVALIEKRAVETVTTLNTELVIRDSA